MTQAEFSKGWKLLILQPWGWRYNKLDAQGKPTEEARSQLEFYFSKLSWGHPDAWAHVANLYAQGDEWPSVNALKASLQAVQSRYVKALPSSVFTGEEPPPEVQERLTKLGLRFS